MPKGKMLLPHEWGAALKAASMFAAPSSLVPEVPPMITREQWAAQFLAELGYPLTQNNYLSMLAWMRSEQGDNNYPNVAAYNPLDTEQPLPGSWNFNDAGVKNYQSLQDGITANVMTINLDYYDTIRSALRSSADPAVTVNTIDASLWGSHPTPETVAEVAANYPENAALTVGPGAVAPAPPPTPGPTLLEDTEMQAVAIVDDNDQIIVLNGQPLWLCVDTVNKNYFQFHSLAAFAAAGNAIHMTSPQWTAYSDAIGIKDLNPPAPEPTPAPEAEAAPAPEAAPAAS